MISFWSEITYLKSWGTNRTINWLEVDTGYINPTIQLYANLTSIEGTVITKSTTGKRFNVSNLAPNMYYGVCIIPMSFGGITHSFCGMKRMY